MSMTVFVLTLPTNKSRNKVGTWYGCQFNVNSVESYFESISIEDIAIKPLDQNNAYSHLLLLVQYKLSLWIIAIFTCLESDIVRGILYRERSFGKIIMISLWVGYLFMFESWIWKIKITSC